MHHGTWVQVYDHLKLKMLAKAKERLTNRHWLLTLPFARAQWVSLYTQDSILTVAPRANDE